MNYFKGEKEFFPGIGKIEFEGRESKNRWLFIIMMKTRS